MLIRKYTRVKANTVQGNVGQARKALFKVFAIGETYQSSELISTEANGRSF